MKILVTGPTGQVATPITLALAKDNEVWGAARFKDEGAKAALEAHGVRCAAVDLVKADFSALPDDFDYVLNLAVVRSGKWSRDLAANGESTGLLMQHCRKARAFLHCSSAAVYAGGLEPLDEESPLGDNHAHLMPTYSISKIAAEVVVRTMARVLDLPTTIARLSVPYGDEGGWPAYHLDDILAGRPVPVIAGGPDASKFNPIHEEDLIASVPKLLEVASAPATTLNWAGPDVVSIQEWCEFLGGIAGKQATFVETEDFTILGTQCDTSRMDELIGPAKVRWQDGLRRMVAARHPELLA